MNDLLLQANSKGVITPNLYSELLFYKMQLEKDFSCIKDLFNSVNSCDGMLVLKLMCACAWVMKSPGCVHEVDLLSGNTFNSLIDLLKKGIHAVSDSNEIKNHLTSIGLKQYYSKCKVHDETLFQFCTDFCKVKFNADAMLKGAEISSSRAIRIYLHLMKEIITRMYIELKRTLEHEIIRLYTTEKCHFKDCKISHDPPSPDVFKFGRITASRLFEIQALCSTAYKGVEKSLIGAALVSEKIDAYTEWLTKFADDNLIGMVSSFVTAWIPFLHVLDPSELTEAFSTPKTVSNQITNALRKKVNLVNGIGGLDELLEISMLSYLSDKQEPVMEELSYEASGNHKWLTHSIKSLSEFLEKLYVGHKITLARREIQVLASMYLMENTFSSLLTLCELVEIPILVLLGASSKIADKSCYITNTQLGYMAFCDRLYNDRNNLEKAIRSFPDHFDTKRELDPLVKILVGYNRKNISPIFLLSENLSKTLYNKKNAAENAQKQAHCERLLAVYLILIVNFSNLYAREIVKGFQSNTIKYAVQTPMIIIFNEIASLQEVNAARRLLERLLMPKGASLKQVNFRRPWDHRGNISFMQKKATSSAPTTQWKIMQKNKTTVMPPNEVKVVENSENDQPTANDESVESVIQKLDGLDLGFKDSTFDTDDIDDDIITDEFVDTEDMKGAKLEKEMKFKARIKMACKIQTWWRTIYSILKEEKKLINAARTIQRWWRMLKTIKEDVFFTADEDYFTSENHCLACNTSFEDKSIHVQEVEMHLKMVEYFEKYKSMKDTVVKLREKIDMYKEENAARNCDDIDVGFSQILAQCKDVESRREWGVVSEIEHLVGALMVRVHAASSQALFAEDDGEEFQEKIEHKPKTRKKGNGAAGGGKKGKGKKKKKK